MILLAEHDEPSLAAKKKQQHGALETATSTPKNRVWVFENVPPGRPGSDPQLTQETATGSVQYSYENVSGRGEFISRDPLSGAEFSQGTNLYAYCGNNFLNRFDPTGMCQDKTLWTALTGLPDSYRQDLLYGAIGTLTASLAVATGGASLAAEGELGAAGTGGAVFWSGGAEAEAAATSFAVDTGGSTLAMTEGGQAAASATAGLDWTAAQPIWAAASQDFAAGAAGDVNAFIGANASSSSIFSTVELPTLLSNPAVTSITITF